MAVILRNLAATLVFLLLFSQACLAKELFMNDGSTIDCEWARISGDKVVVQINRDILLQFETREVDMGKTFRVPRKHLARHKRIGKPLPSTASAAVAAGAKKTEATTANSEAASPRVPEGKPSAAKTLLLVNAAPQAAKGGTAPAPVSAQAPPPVPIRAATPAAKGDQGDTAAPPSSYLPDRQELEDRNRKASEMWSEAVEKHDPKLFVQALIAQKELLKDEGVALLPAIERATGPVKRNLLILLVCSLPVIGSLWVLFEKAGRGSLSSLVPVYNLYVLMKVAGRSGWWVVGLFVPVLGAVLYVLSMISLAQRFQKNVLFGLGLSLLPMLFFPILAFTGTPAENSSSPVSLSKEMIEQIKATQAQKAAREAS